MMISGKKIFLLLPVILCVFTSMAQDEIIHTLMKRGFPLDYAEKLAVLQKKYPNWHFEPLPVTELNPQYTWEYVLYMETDKEPSRSLISGKKEFAGYFHPTDLRTYDSGCRRASKEAVAYFLDPRNFLNERDIFQFRNLRHKNKVPLRVIKFALRNTFMEKEKLENGMTYYKFLARLGSYFHIDPLFLASRLRQEQGIKGTPLVSGKCGTLLQNMEQTSSKKSDLFSPNWLLKKIDEHNYLQYDGLYNFFNINASGDGVFTIYFNGMKEAQKGTPEMAEKWGSPQWNTRWKAIFGGTLKIARLYVYNHQNTIYLQKWNVDFRSRTTQGTSRNFWGQYMQNIGAAFCESCNTWRTLKKHRQLKYPQHFIIPVYSGMPPLPCPDPAKGKCIYYRQFGM